MSSETDTRFYCAFGQLAADFARLEAALRSLIAGVAFGSDPAIAGVFLERSQLSANVEILKKLAKKFWAEQARIEAISHSIDQLRPERNLFIHGLWSPSSFGEGEGCAKVMDLKTTYPPSSTVPHAAVEEPDQKTWTCGKDQTYTLDQFKAIHSKVVATIEEIEALMDHLEQRYEIHFQGPFAELKIFRPQTNLR